MTTAVKATDTDAPASKRGRKTKEELAELPPLDLASLKVETGVAMPARKRQTADNPFVQHVKDSYEFEDARAVTVATVNAKRVISLIRRAADAQGVGVSIFEKEIDGDQTTITFAAKDRRTRTVTAKGDVTGE